MLKMIKEKLAVILILFLALPVSAHMHDTMYGYGGMFFGWIFAILLIIVLILLIVWLIKQIQK